MKLSKSQLERTLLALAKANTRAQFLRSKIYDHSIAVYGADPADIDCDEFIDACDGGNGSCGGMTAEQFDDAMRLALKRNA